MVLCTGKLRVIKTLQQLTRGNCACLMCSYADRKALAAALRDIVAAPVETAFTPDPAD